MPTTKNVLRLGNKHVSQSLMLFEMIAKELDKYPVKSSCYYDAGFFSTLIFDHLQTIKDELVVLYFNQQGEGNDFTDINWIDNVFYIVRNNPCTKFVIVAVFSRYFDLNIPPNCQIVYTEAINPGIEYQKIQPQGKKDFTPNKFWLYLNHIPKMHRITLACILLGRGLGLAVNGMSETGTIRITNSPIMSYKSFREYYPFSMSKLNDTEVEQLERGFDHLKYLRNGGQPCGDPYQGFGGQDNARNYNENLRPLYKHAAIDIVSCTWAHFTHPWLPDKMLNAWYGLVFPMVLGPPLTIQTCRNYGFDTFDDIINNDYDKLTDHLLRFFRMIDDNIELLTNKMKTVDLWYKNKHRFNNNIDRLKKIVPDQQNNDIVHRFKKAVENWYGN